MADGKGDSATVQAHSTTVGDGPESRPSTFAKAKFSQVPFEPSRAVRPPANLSFRFLDKHPLFQRRSSPACRPYEPRPLQASPVAPLSAHARPRHQPIIIPPERLTRPLTPDSSPDSVRASDDFSPRPLSQSNSSEVRPSKPVSRHVPIQIPAFAHPFGNFPPTPAPSAGNTPRGSISKSSDGRGSVSNSSDNRGSLSHDRKSGSKSTYDMSRPNTSGSNASTADTASSSGALSSTHKSGERPPPLPNSYIAEEQVKPSTTANSLSGLVCDVHRCTGREPHGLVGASTTVLGDKLFVFGGRCLSKRKPYLTSEMYELDLLRRHWTKIRTTGDVPSPRYFHSVCALGTSKLVCYGGMSPQDADDMAVMSDIHIYDVNTCHWTAVATGESPPGRYAHCAAILPSSASSSSAMSGDKSTNGDGGAKMIVVGGQDNSNKYIDAISVFNLRNLSWADTQSLPRSCGAYRSVVTPLTSPDIAQIGSEVEDVIDKQLPASAMLIYSNYNFLDVKLELQIRLPSGVLVEKPMKGPVSPPGLRFPNGEILDNHFIVSGTYLTSSKHDYALWALDLRTLRWSRIDAGSGIFSQGSWNRGILWARRNTFIILGNRRRSLVDDYNHRRINFSDICLVDLEAFGLYENPRRSSSLSTYRSASAPACLSFMPNGPPLNSAAKDLGLMAMTMRDFADMDLLAIGGERLPVNSHILARRWGPYFVKLLRDNAPAMRDNASSSDGGTLRPSTIDPRASRNSSVTITPSMATTLTPSVASATSTDAPTPLNLPANTRYRQLYLPHTILTLRALAHFLYTLTLPGPGHTLCTPQILCSLLQLARPYCIDGLLEATVERLHQILDSRNAAAIFNAAAMAAGGGRGTGAPFHKEADEASMDAANGGLTMTRLQARTTRAASEDVSNRETDTRSEASSGTSGTSEDTAENSEKEALGVEEAYIWNGGVSAVMGLQKRGLRGLIEERRKRETVVPEQE